MNRYRPLLTVFYGITVFLWLSPEESGLILVSVLGLGGAALIGWHLAARFHTYWPWRSRIASILIGALVGGGAALMTALLMFFKTSLHAHLFPDYPLSIILATLERFPAWAAAGALCGLGWIALR